MNAEQHRPTTGLAPRVRIDTSTPAPARRYDYLLGGKDNFAADRESAEAIAKRFPSVRVAALENRRFLQRVVRHLAGEVGIDQYIDVGTGIPTEPNVHQLAQVINPAARILCVDNDPVVMVHARALLTGTPAGRVDYIEADLRDPDAILRNPALHRTIDLSRPTALLLIAVLHFVDHHDHPTEHVARLVAALPPGSVLAISHVSFDLLPADVATELDRLNTPDAGHGTFRPRTHAEIAQFFDGLHLIEPGLVPINEWRPHLHPPPQATPDLTGFYGALAYKP